MIGPLGMHVAFFTQTTGMLHVNKTLLALALPGMKAKSPVCARLGLLWNQKISPRTRPDPYKDFIVSDWYKSKSSTWAHPIPLWNLKIQPGAATRRLGSVSVWKIFCQVRVGCRTTKNILSCSGWDSGWLHIEISVSGWI